ncbi:hypothetical protein HK104_010203 [Borealophlyctis nickersoniae]|nr:hypothetical protein HK104_010203 [Borealophlyctis nickersoniae]
MTLVDTLDGIVMLATYSYATLNPALKLYYNFIVTLLSVLIAIFVGTMVTLGIVADRYELEGAFWDGVRAIGDQSGVVGYVVIGLFVTVLLLGLVGYRFGVGRRGDGVVETMAVEEGRAGGADGEGSAFVVPESGDGGSDGGVCR